MSQDLLSVDSSPPLPSLGPTRTSDEGASVTIPQPHPHQLQDGAPQEATVTTPPMRSGSFAAALRCPNKAVLPPIWPGRESTKAKVLSPTGEQEIFQGHVLSMMHTHMYGPNPGTGNGYHSSPVEVTVCKMPFECMICTYVQ